MKPAFRPCPACARHIRDTETACPFCHAQLSDSFRAALPAAPTRGRLPRSALVLLGASLAGAPACSSGTMSGQPVDAATNDGAKGGSGGSTGTGGAMGTGGSAVDAARDSADGNTDSGQPIDRLPIPIYGHPPLSDDAG
ncbi:MAG TPA: hypothetical protein VH374_19865 [Polyangia bacterium]|jgi:hypothetical protein|nr:hypothetical protein [Polyangia bacterium]